MELSNNRIDIERASLLAGLMQNLCLNHNENRSTLKEIVLKKCQMTNDDIIALLRGLSTNNTIKIMDLADNHFTA